ncbi:hypothetical protein N7490_007640 [Penicillium lividum]|nr:hypothetical protein N7490_007640 [Penicillium lividum]
MSEGGGKEAQSAPYQARVDEEHSQDEYAQPELQAEGIESDDAQDEENQESGNVRFASNVPNLAAEDRALVLSLLKKAQSKMEGSNQPRDVMRCIGLNSKIQDKITNEKCAILVRFPYYSIQKMETATQSRYDAGDKPRSLLQYHYNFESTRKRDLEQIVRKSGLFPRDHILHVLQMWAVIVNFSLSTFQNDCSLMMEADENRIYHYQCPNTADRARDILFGDRRSPGVEFVFFSLSHLCR